MITIYSADSEGRMFTDPKQHFYIDGELLREKAVALRIRATLNQIAQRAGFRDYDSLDTYARCSGITADVLENWILSGKLLENLH